MQGQAGGFVHHPTSGMHESETSMDVNVTTGSTIRMLHVQISGRFVMNEVVGVILVLNRVEAMIFTFDVTIFIVPACGITISPAEPVRHL